MTGVLTTSDPVEEGYFYDSYCVTTKDGVNYKLELWSDSGQYIYVSAETAEGEEELFSTGSYNYITQTGEAGSAAIYVSAYQSDVTSGSVSYRFKISSI